MKNTVIKSIMFLSLLLSITNNIFSMGKIPVVEFKIDANDLNKWTNISLTSFLKGCVSPFFNTPARSATSIIGIGLALGSTIYSVKKYYDRYQELKAIEAWLYNSSESNNYQYNSGHSSLFMQEYPLASDLLTNVTKARRQIDLLLSTDGLNKDNFRRENFDNEIIYLKNLLAYLMPFTPFGFLLKNKLKETKVQIISDDKTPLGYILNYFHTVIGSCLNGNPSQLHTMESKFNETSEELKNNPQLGRFFYKSSHFITKKRLINFPDVTLCNARKATLLFNRVLRRYMRLYALQQIINNSEFLG